MSSTVLTKYSVLGIYHRLSSKLCQRLVLLCARRCVRFMLSCPAPIFFPSNLSSHANPHAFVGCALGLRWFYTIRIDKVKKVGKEGWRYPRMLLIVPANVEMSIWAFEIERGLAAANAVVRPVASGFCSKHATILRARCSHVSQGPLD